MKGTEWLTEEAKEQYDHFKQYCKNKGASEEFLKEFQKYADDYMEWAKSVKDQQMEDEEIE